MILTEVGFSGGSTSHPSYYKMGDHTEVVRLHFNPDLTSLQSLLQHFWRSHDSTAARPAQYRSLIVCSSEKQLETAGELLSAQRKSLTVLLSDQVFHLAEEKHQKYYFSRHPALVRSLAWEDSPATSVVASRLNGYLGGHGNMAAFNREWQSLGLTSRIAEYVREVIVRRG